MKVFLKYRSCKKQYSLQVFNIMGHLTVEIKVTDNNGKTASANIDYAGYVQTKKVHNISLIEDVVEHLITEVKNKK